ncbi:MAG: DUF3341 domain-containing protein [Planctomycetota bacterium]
MTAAYTTLPNDLRVPEIAVEDDRPVLAGVLAEYEDVDSVYAAAEKVRDSGYTRWDVHSPFPIHGIEKAMNLRPTILPWICLGGGLAGLFGGLFLCVWTMSTSFSFAGGLQGYEYLISGKPMWSLPQFIPVIFETTILLAAFSAGLGMIALNALPMLYNPLLRSERFRRVTDDRFFIVVDASDPKFDVTETEQLLRDTGTTAVERVVD